MLTRRHFLAAGAALPLLGPGAGVSAIGVERNLVAQVKRYALAPVHWPAGLNLRLAVLSDIHACEPVMSAERIARICVAANALQPDAILLLGDFNAGHPFIDRAVTSQQIGEALSLLRAPLGCYAVLGNHDWNHGDLVGSPSDGAFAIRRALQQAGIAVLENDAVSLRQDGHKFWIVGLGDQLALGPSFGRGGGAEAAGLDDLPAALAQVTDDAPIVLMAHEPMIFPAVPKRVALTLSGHTHGGQVNLPLFGPVVGKMRFGPGMVYGHVQSRDRHLIVSGGLGDSSLPLRFMQPPEIVEVLLGAPEGAPA